MIVAAATRPILSEERSSAESRSGRIAAWWNTRRPEGAARTRRGAAGGLASLEIMGPDAPAAVRSRAPVDRRVLAATRLHDESRLRVGLRRHAAGQRPAVAH